MTKNEINLSHAELHKLLKDTCRFLSEEIAKGCISIDRKQVAENLIERSTAQLKTMYIFNVDTSEAYVDMQGCKVNQETDPQELYSDVPLTFENISNSSSINEEIICPYANSSATEIKDGKSGYLYRKGKFFIFEQQKKIYAAIQQSWLLIYMNENSPKPCQTHDLTRWEAKPAPLNSRDSKKRDDSFDLISLIDAKSFHFTALTRKDMLQWVSAINQHLDKKVSSRSLPPLPGDKAEDEALESSNEYEPLKDYRVPDSKQPTTTEINTVIDNRIENVTKSQTLPLPPRNKKPPLKEIQVNSQPSSEESLDTYDCVDYSTTSFSEDDSDTHYDNPTELRKAQVRAKDITKNKSNSNKTHKQEDDSDKDEIYDVLSPAIVHDKLQITKPSQTESNEPPSPPPTLPEKPKLVKPKMPSLNNIKKH